MLICEQDPEKSRPTLKSEPFLPQTPLDGVTGRPNTVTIVVMVVLVLIVQLVSCLWLASLDRGVGQVLDLVKPKPEPKAEVTAPKPVAKTAPAPQPQFLAVFTDAHKPPRPLFGVLDNGALGMISTNSSPVTLARAFWRFCDGSKSKLPDKRTLLIQLPGYGMEVDVVERTIMFVPPTVMLPANLTRFWGEVEANGKAEK